MLSIGRLGEFDLPAGLFAYVGSAHGSGGLRARMMRHLNGSARLHWHIDYLRRAAGLEAVAWQIGLEALECAWVQAYIKRHGAIAPVPGFGASDCRLGCPAHLLYLPNGVQYGSSTEEV